jgi:glycosyltransferase involved in cell wall biosynthesis
LSVNVRTRQRPLRILAIGSSASTHVVNRVRCFADRGHHVSVLTEQVVGLDRITELVPSAPPGQDAWVTTLLRPAGRLIRRNGVVAADMVRLMLDYRRLLRKAAPDIVHVHYAYSTWGWMAAALGCKPLVVSVMGGDVLFEEQGSPTPRGISLTKRLLQSADLITAKSKFLIGVLDSFGGFGGKSMRVVWGVDPEIFKPLDGGELRAELGIPADAKVVFSPKILQPFYNIDILIEAMAQVVRRESRAHLVVTEYGADAAYRAQLIAQIESLGLQKNVTFVGRIHYERMPQFYSIADVSVGIPRSDGLPQTLLEAMACGVPNIIGRLDRYGEIVTDGQSAIFADITPASVADRILHLFADEKLRRSISTNGRKVVMTEANFPHDVRRLEEAYFRLIDTQIRRRMAKPLMLTDVARYWLRV